MTIEINIPQLTTLAAAISDLASAHRGGQPFIPAATLPPPPLESKRGRGRPPKEAVPEPPSEAVTAETQPSAPDADPQPEPPTPDGPIDYDALLTEIRAYSTRVLDLDAKAKNRVNRERQKAYLREIHPEGARGIVSEVPKEKWPTILAWFKATWPQLDIPAAS